jgi:hypothetical protein
MIRSSIIPSGLIVEQSVNSRMVGVPLISFFSCNSCEVSRVIILIAAPLVVEPDYLPDLEVFYFQPCLYPMKYLHPRSMYTLPRGGVQRGGTPSAGSGGAIPPAGGSGGKRAPSGGSGVKPPKKKLPCKSIL